MRAHLNSDTTFQGFVQDSPKHALGIPAAVRNLDFIEDLRLYTPQEIARILNTDEKKADFTRRLLRRLRREFPDGVLNINTPTPGKRVRQQMRVFGWLVKIAIRRMMGR